MGLWLLLLLLLPASELSPPRPLLPTAPRADSGPAPPVRPDATRLRGAAARTRLCPPLPACPRVGVRGQDGGGEGTLPLPTPELTEVCVPAPPLPPASPRQRLGRAARRPACVPPRTPPPHVVAGGRAGCRAGTPARPDAGGAVGRSELVYRLRGEGDRMPILWKKILRFKRGLKAELSLCPLPHLPTRAHS